MVLKVMFVFSKKVKLRDIYLPGDSFPDLRVSQLEVTISTFKRVMFHHS